MQAFGMYVLYCMQEAWGKGGQLAEEVNSAGDSEYDTEASCESLVCGYTIWILDSASDSQNDFIERQVQMKIHQISIAKKKCCVSEAKL